MTRSYGIRIPTGVAGYPDKSSSSLHNSVPGTIDQVAVQDVYDQSVDVPLFVKSASITMDRTWSPYCQASLVCVQPSAAQLALIDPRTGMRARFQLTATVDDVAVAPQYFDLGIRSTSLDWDTGELTLSCASDEAWTQDVGLLTAAPQYAVAGATSTDLRTLVLNTFPLPYVNTQPSTTGMGANPTVVDPLWQPGQSWADYVTPAVEAAGAWLYCDEAAVFHLTAPSWVADATARTLTDAAHIKSVLETVSRDDPTWATSAVVSYTPKDTGATTFDAPISGGRESFGRTVLVARSGKKPVAGAADTVAGRMRGRGRNVVAQALLDITARPNQSWTVNYQGLSRSGKAQSVVMNLPDGTMQLTVNT